MFERKTSYRCKDIYRKKDAQKAKQYFEPDVLLSEGDVVCLGNTKIEVIEPPGHTEGTISLFYETEENGEKYQVGTFGGAGANTLAKGKFDYENCRSDYLESINKLRKKKVDVFIGNHVWNNDTERKSILLKEAGDNQFIDKDVWYEFLDFCEKRLYETVDKD